MVKLPCKDCQNRHPACHDTCAEYLEAKEEHVKEKNYLKEKTVPPNLTKHAELPYEIR